jgi:hypothetical protein
MLDKAITGYAREALEELFALLFDKIHRFGESGVHRFLLP